MAIQWVAQEGHLGLARALADKGLDAHAPNENGHTALHKACIKGHLTVACWLVEDIGFSLSCANSKLPKIFCQSVINLTYFFLIWCNVLSSLLSVLLTLYWHTLSFGDFSFLEMITSGN